ncbi:unnamed protein product [Bursaphelenchus okinawaensis]|uniref:Phosphatidylserine synthase n=1 Tax=Bursaphelenchus okinawaensis TaxID=465554 RepID=A0A811KZ93_9BILA|nr:unnamed protein product [Bursaphelenchus okinawaensis]CAG9113348.1 unnamed protein product [Bursaphelenchus okinawaensis]
MKAAQDSYRLVNDRSVDNITLHLLYQPHSISILLALAVYSIYNAFLLQDSQSDQNIFSGVKATIILFLFISAFISPNGPFIRPHPVVWRIVFGVSVLYALLLQLTLFQSFDDVKKVLTWLDPDGLSKRKIEETSYAEACWDITLDRILASVDFFVVAHFVGWVMKALLIRHTIICWYISILWELTELFFGHVLPNFRECWWDAILLDILLCNGLGIYCGIKLCKFLEFHEFHWESIKEIQTAGGKMRRVVLQFTPESWIRVDWFNNRSLRRCGAIFLFIMFWLLAELNTFFLKSIVVIDVQHPLVTARLVLICFISAPTIRQWYLFVTDPRTTRIGMQTWTFALVCILELAICIKFGRKTFESLQMQALLLWIVVVVIGTIICVWISVKWTSNSASDKTQLIKVGEETRRLYKCSSTDNLVAVESQKASTEN